MLPASRNETCTNATPVNPNLLNDIQDCIVGSKHGPLSLLLAPHSFSSRGGTGSLLSGRWVGADIYFCDIRALEGQQLTSIVFGRDRSGAGTIEFYARRFNIVTEAQATGLLATVAAGTGYATTTVDEAAIIAALGWSIVPANEAVIIEVVTSDAANKFGGAVVELSRP